MIKKVKAFTLIEALVIFAMVTMLIVMFLPIFNDTYKGVIKTQVGDAVYIDTLCITGIVNSYNWPRVTLLVKGTNGLPVQLEAIDVRLLKKVPPSPENEWKH